MEETDIGLDDQPTDPPASEEEFTNDDGSNKWDHGLRVLSMCLDPIP